MTTEYTPAMATAAVERGAAWLDEHCPDWTSHINLDKLDLGSQSACMLGQTAECLMGAPARTRRYARVLDHFEQSVRWAEIHGFDVPDSDYFPGTSFKQYSHEIEARYEMLTIAWSEYIRQRVESAEVVVECRP